MKYLELPCPTCKFPHQFKRESWYEGTDVYIGLYATDDMKSRKECQQQLTFGTGPNDKITLILNKGFKE